MGMPGTTSIQISSKHKHFLDMLSALWGTTVKDTANRIVKEVYEFHKKDIDAMLELKKSVAERGKINEVKSNTMDDYLEKTVEERLHK